VQSSNQIVHQQTNIQLLTGWMPFCCPANSLKALKGKKTVKSILQTIGLHHNILSQQCTIMFIPYSKSQNGYQSK